MWAIFSYIAWVLAFLVSIIGICLLTIGAVVLVGALAEAFLDAREYMRLRRQEESKELRRVK